MIKKLTLATLLTCCACAPAMGMDYKKMLAIGSGITVTLGGLYFGYTYLYPTATTPVQQPKPKLTSQKKLKLLQEKAKTLFEGLNKEDTFYNQRNGYVKALCKRFSTTIKYDEKATASLTFKTNVEALIEMFATNESAYDKAMTELLKVFEEK